MGRPKGSKNKKPAACHKPKLKSQFANTKMADQLHEDFSANRGAYAYEGLYAKYQRIFDKEYFCLIDFDTAWKRLLRKVQELHGVDYQSKHDNIVAARTKPRNRTSSSTHEF